MDATQVEKLKRMDSCAWEELLNLYTAQLHRDIVASLRKRGLTAEMAEDIQQQTWLTAVHKIHEFVYQGEDKLYRWLRAISLNHVRSLQRQRRSMTIISSESDEYVQFANGYFAESVEESVVLREQIAAVYQALRYLSPQAREMVVRSLIGGEKPEQLASSFPRLKPHSISQAVFRAKQRIRAECAEVC